MMNAAADAKVCSRNKESAKRGKNRNCELTYMCMQITNRPCDPVCESVTWVLVNARYGWAQTAELTTGRISKGATVHLKAGARGSSSRRRVHNARSEINRPPASLQTWGLQVVCVCVLEIP